MAPLPDSHYSGVHSSGPLWSMRPRPGTESLQRLWAQNTKSELLYRFQLLDEEGHLVASEECTKVFVKPGVQRIGVKQGRIQGALFLPPFNPDPGPPTRAVMTIYGAHMRGRAPEEMAALLASQGFVAFTPYYWSEAIDVEMFEGMVDYLLALDQVEDKRVHLWGISRGGDVVVAMAAFLGNKIGGVMCVNNAFISSPGPTFYKDKVVKGIPVEADLHSEQIFKTDVTEEEFINSPDYQFPIEDCQGPILLVQGLADTLLPLCGPVVEIIRERALRRGKEDFTVLQYPGLGHLVDPPNFPVSRTATHPFLPRTQKIFYGGDLQQHGLAQFDVWDRMLDFFNKV